MHSKYCVMHKMVNIVLDGSYAIFDLCIVFSKLPWEMAILSKLRLAS